MEAPGAAPGDQHGAVLLSNLLPAIVAILSFALPAQSVAAKDEEGAGQADVSGRAEAGPEHSRRTAIDQVAVAVLEPEAPAATTEARRDKPLPWARLTGGASVTLNLGVDTNARRVIGETAVTDTFAGLSARAKGGVHLGQNHLFHGRYDIGLKKFINLDAEDLMVQRLRRGYAAHLSAWRFDTEAEAKLRSSRNGLRDYLDVSALFSARRQIGRDVSLRGEMGARRFSYPHADDYGFWAGELSLWGTWQPHRRVQLTLGVRGALPDYDGEARLSDASHGDERRRDHLLSVRLQAAYRGPVVVQAGYLWIGNWSNSFGESFQRHRLFAAMTARLPWSIFVGLHLAWQSVHYPDGLFLSDDLIDLLLYDDESLSNSTLKLSRPIGRHLEIELKYSLSYGELPRRDDDTSLSYLRQVATIGVVGRI